VIPIRVAVQRDDFDVAAEIGRLKHAPPQRWCRGHFHRDLRDEDGRLRRDERRSTTPAWRRRDRADCARSRFRWPLAGSRSCTATAASFPARNIVLVVTAATIASRARAASF